MFESKSVEAAVRFRDDLTKVAQRLARVGAIDADGPATLGVRLNLSHGYRTVATCGAPPEIADRLFLRLLDARIATGVVRAALERHGAEFPGEAWRFEIDLADDDRAALAAERLGGTNGSAIVCASLNAGSGDRWLVGLIATGGLDIRDYGPLRNVCASDAL